MELLDVWSDKLNYPNPYYRAFIGDTMDKRDEKGKGGNFDTRTNPFLKMRETLGTAPDLSGCTSLLGGIQCALQAGCAVMIGATRDGGALCITVLDGQERHRTYAANIDDVDAAAQALMQMYA